MKLIPLRLLFLAALIFMVQSQAARAASAFWAFEPTEAEWQTWPEYCRVQWTKWTDGFDPKGNKVYSAATMEQWRQSLGAQTFDSMHHWCAGTIYLNRYRLESGAQQKQFLLTSALNETLFTRDRAEKLGQLYPTISVTLAQIHQEMGKPEQAVSVLKQAIAAQPQRTEAYGALASLYRKNGDRTQARAVLLQANTIASGQSAEIQYALGLLNIELGDIDAAVANAKAAYSRGYPLPGLKRKLTELKRWPDGSKTG